MEDGADPVGPPGCVCFAEPSPRSVHGTKKGCAYVSLNSLQHSVVAAIDTSKPLEILTRVHPTVPRTLKQDIAEIHKEFPSSGFRAKIKYLLANEKAIWERLTQLTQKLVIALKQLSSFEDKTNIFVEVVYRLCLQVL